jgi:hypothetical protein
MTTIHLPTISKTLKISWAVYKNTWDMWLLGALLMIVASIFGLDKSGFISILFGMFFALGLLSGKFSNFHDLAKNISLYKLWRFSISLLVLTFFVLLGLVLFILPGIYIAIRYGLVPYRYAMNESMSLKDAYHEMKKVTKPILTKYFVLNIGLCLFFFFAIVLTLGLGLVVFAPMSMISTAYLYKIIFDQVDSKKELE